ncbi:MAG TPA: serine hydrolase [Blastocatellia bacterium]|nr:serine hydrolase [Blastocatellia bacterium]
MKPPQIVNSLFLLAFAMGIFALPYDQATEIDRFMETLHERGQFNGGIIVAIAGKPIYRRAFGYANVQSHTTFTPATISNIGSVAKQFTAMTVMMLAQQNKIKYDDAVSKYIPELAETLNGIILRHLLNHTSGIPDVGDLGIDHPKLTNDEVLKRLSKPGFLVSSPGEKYRYSNPNYVLLAVVAERVSGRRFADFLSEKILKPLGMVNTFVHDGSRSDPIVTATAYDQFGNLANDDALITGSGGMYSTLDDLLKWDQALYTERLISQSTLAEAFTPGHVKEGATTYGFGWNLGEQEGHKYVWHQGATGGFRALIERRLREKITVIILTNKGNSKRLEINDAILNILSGKPYVFPKRSIAEAMYEVISKEGFQAAIKTYSSLRAANDSTYDFAESELNALGYQLLYGNHKTSEAIEIFKLNTDAYPKSSNAYDSLAEAHQASGNKDLAIKNYQTAVELDPTNLHAVNMLKKLR